MQKISIKVIDGHLTAADKRAINAILTNGKLAAKVGRKSYSISEVNGIYAVTYKVNDRGLIPVAGSAIRTSTYRATFKINNHNGNPVHT